MTKARDATYQVIGLMSGTSMDGLDLALCRFWKKRKWEFKIQSAVTMKYSRAWRGRLAAAQHLSMEQLLELDSLYGKLIGSCCADFIRARKIRHLDLIASHGHTIFHQPERGFTFQLGSGNAIHAITGVPVIYDFRSLDILLGGQGAPLVPVGDRHLFGSYDLCLNLGGIANLSMERNDQRVAFDICFANMGLNFLARNKGKEFDRDGKMASRGISNKRLLSDLAAAYAGMRKNRPALARESFETLIQPLLESESILLEDRMMTFCQSIADEINLSIPTKRNKQSLLATGGGALNPFLVKLLQNKLEGKATVMIPSRQIIEFKEAMVFAFLGLLRVRGEINVLKSVTRATRDSCSGVVAALSPMQ